MFRLFIDSDNGVDVNPLYDYVEVDKKVESRHRTRSGNEYAYKFGDYQHIKMSVTYVDSTFKAIVNSWWNSNADLLFMEEGGTEISSVHLINKELPIGKFMKPYTDQFGGKIELGSY